MDITKLPKKIRDKYEDKVLEQAYQEDRWQDKKWNAEDMAQEQYTEGQE